MGRDLKRARRWLFGGAVVAIGGAAVLFRHELPALIALLDFGPAPIEATSLSQKIAQPRQPDVGRSQSEVVDVRRVAFPPLGTKTQPTTTIAAWSFQAADLVVAEEPERAWRTTFGAERTERESVPASVGFKADIVAVTGIRNFQLLRKVFPARDYFVIASPQLINQALIQGRSQSAFQFPNVALVVRRRAGVLARRREQMVFANDGVVLSEIDRELGSTPSDLTVAARPSALPFAVFMIAGGTRFWLVAADLTGDCEVEVGCAKQATQDARLKSWIARQVSSGAPVVLVSGVGSVERWRQSRPDAPKPVFSVGYHGGVPAGDDACERPRLALEVWLPEAAEKATDQTSEASIRPLGEADLLWRARPTAGDCVLLARLPIAPKRQRTPPTSRPGATSPVFSGDAGADRADDPELDWLLAPPGAPPGRN
ncbi:MAG: hypothetical protein AAFQ11_03735 [Pseudomonadota bacterium]